MIDFLNAFTVGEFLVYTVTLLLAIEASVRFFDWLNGRFNLVETRKTREEARFEAIESKLNQLLDASEHQAKSTSTLLESDMVRIKGEIIREHAAHVRQGSIDYKTLDYLQRQFHCYQMEGGNSYVHNLMDDLEGLPLSD